MRQKPGVPRGASAARAPLRLRHPLPASEARVGHDNHGRVFARRATGAHPSPHGVGRGWLSVSETGRGEKQQLPADAREIGHFMRHPTQLGEQAQAIEANISHRRVDQHLFEERIDRRAQPRHDPHRTGKIFRRDGG